jgi:exodeoxyribonuclease VII small subunit
MMTRAGRRAGFEAQLKTLEDIVAKLEDGSLPLEESLAIFEKGIRLSRELQSSLQQASMRVTRLLETEPPREAPLEEGEEEPEPPSETGPRS